MIEAEPSFGMRIVAGMPGMNKNTGAADRPTRGLASAQARDRRRSGDEVV